MLDEVKKVHSIPNRIKKQGQDDTHWYFGYSILMGLTNLNLARLFGWWRLKRVKNKWK